MGLTCLDVPAPTPQVSERLGRRHKTIAQWTRQMIRVVRRWLPNVAITVLGDQAYSVVELGHACRRCGVRLIAPLRLDAVLHEAPPARQPGMRGRPPLKGKRLPTLARRLDDPATPWQPLWVRWYDGGVRCLQVSTPVVSQRAAAPAAQMDSGPSSRLPVPTSGLLLDVSERSGFYASSAGASRFTVLTWALRRSVNGRTWRLNAPCPLVTLLADALWKVAWRFAIPKEQATFSDALAAVRQHLWAVEYFSTSASDGDRLEIPRLYLHRLMQSACYTH